jgi:hypothetical protein
VSPPPAPPSSDELEYSSSNRQNISQQNRQRPSTSDKSNISLKAGSNGVSNDMGNHYGGGNVKDAYAYELNPIHEQSELGMKVYRNPSVHHSNIKDMAIRVIVRKKPISKTDYGKGERDIMEIRENGQVLVHEPKIKVDLTKVVETQQFIFDDAFEDYETNELIYARAISPLVDIVFEGGKASCFAYGQTGAGTLHVVTCYNKYI